MKSRYAALIGASFLLLGANGLAHAGKADDTLNIGWDNALPSYDLYFNQSVAEGQMIGRLIWDHLLERNLESGEYTPNLATDWAWIDPLTLEFNLRKGIKFHDGSDFNADDVVFTVNWVVNPENKVNIQNMVSWMESAEKIDEFKVRIRLKKPWPAALDYLASTLAIYPSDYYEKVGPKGMSDKPVGTGPYKVTEAIAGETVTLVLNEDYPADGPKKGSIGKIVQRTIPEVQTQVAELMAGRLDWIWRVPSDMAPMLGANPQLSTVVHESMRISYITLDAKGNGGAPQLADVKVRQAINHAVNREAIVQYLVPGTRLISANCHPIQFGCSYDVPTYNYDPEKAKQLLAEAGYPNGFNLDLYAYRDRQITEAIIGDLRAVGLNANLIFMTFPALYEKKLKHETGMVHSTTGSWSIADASVPLSVTFQGGPADMGYDEELTGWINEAANLLEPEKRKELYQRAYTRIMERAYLVPLSTDVLTYAMSKDLEFKPSTDEVGRFYTAKWK
jgi:peptide/nickel transport system substrate-binding protein